jgi:hypothetical protein
MSPERVAQQARWAGTRMPLAYAERAPAHLSAAAERERQDAKAAQANDTRPYGAPRPVNRRRRHALALPRRAVTFRPPRRVSSRRRSADVG